MRAQQPPTTKTYKSRVRSESGVRRTDLVWDELERSTEQGRSLFGIGRLIYSDAYPCFDCGAMTKARRAVCIGRLGSATHLVLRYVRIEPMNYFQSLRWKRCVRAAYIR